MGMICHFRLPRVSPPVGAITRVPKPAAQRSSARSALPLEMGWQRGKTGTKIAPTFGMALYLAEALLGDRASDVWELVTENF
jgi:hypothetical protein